MYVFLVQPNPSGSVAVKLGMSAMYRRVLSWDLARYHMKGALRFLDYGLRRFLREDALRLAGAGVVVYSCDVRD